LKEDFIIYIWEFQLYNHNDLKSDDGQSIQIIEKGQRNHDSGPDFFNAKIKIEETLWVGHVEIHTKASHWKQHKHQLDKAYENVILHVVLHNDVIIQRMDGTVIPTLTLQNKIEPAIALKWQSMLASRNWIPCEQSIKSINEFTWFNWKNRLLIERLESKANQIQELLDWTKNDWNTCFYIFLARSFGMKVNQEPFEFLAKSLPLNIIQKHLNQPLLINALFFGQAGFLEQPFKESYPNKLKNEYKFLKQKYNLTPIPNQSWKFSKLRPANFPTIRIAQLAAIIQNNPQPFSWLLELNNITKIESLFNIEVESYWHNHYQFNKLSKAKKKQIGKTFKKSVLINSIIPFVFTYFKTTSQENKIESLIESLEKLPSEQNSIVNKWQNLGVTCSNTADSQALIQLKKQYCDKKKCLHCSIGHTILNN